MSSSKLTPMIKQYLSIKDDYPDAILLYRMGDFYEMFFEDAETASRALEITLTSRNKNDNKPIPMCGVPVRAVQGYIARLVDSGFKVALCDQVEDPAQAKGLVKREVVRVLTPGMLLEDELLDRSSNNYILAMAIHNEKIGLAYLDISTGTFRLTETEDWPAAGDEALRVDPREILIPESFRGDVRFEGLTAPFVERPLTALDDKVFSHARGREQLMTMFHTMSLEGFGCESMKAGIRAAGALVHYLKETQKQAVDHFNGIETYHLNGYMWVDDRSCRNLELAANLQTGSRKGTLLDVLDQTRTAMGGRLLREWLRYPLMDREQIIQRHDAVAEGLDQNRRRNDIRSGLKQVHDLERLGSKISMGRANARDLIALKQSLQALPALFDHLKELQSGAYHSEVDPIPLVELADRIEKAVREDAPPVLNEGGLIKTGYDPELDELVQISRDGKGYLAQLEARERTATGINALKVRYNKVFGYYIEVPKARATEVPAHYVRKQTLVNAERYITDELKTFEAKVLNAEDHRASLEFELFNALRTEAARHHAQVKHTAMFLATVDCLLGLAEVAEQRHFVRPGINTDGVIHLEEGRHPVIEQMLTGERFVPNTIHMDMASEQVLIITGPNMAGKSTVLRQVALTVLMAQIGAFVPAEKASVPVVDKIFTRVGALDNLSQGQSTFMVEMQETANILRNATADSLVILDEIGRGTSTYDGMSIAWAVAEYLHDLDGQGVKTLFATHYHELTDLSAACPRVKNHNIAVKEWNDEIIFLRKLVDGGTNRSYGIQVARLAGIPDPVIKRSKKILADIEKEGRGVGRSDGVGGSKTPPSGQVQLDLFKRPGHAVIERLCRIDVSRTTPMDALKLLSELQDCARSDS
ncbi:MAG: DNA mismatch repair protein MutS [Deltaproteobacteria bacterium]|nr:DNA mismatch repair protein MutS [Deltaproteobacteria bacterium]